MKCIDAVSSQQQSVIDLFDTKTIEQGERFMQKVANAKSSQFSEQPLYSVLIFNFRSKTFEDPNSPNKAVEGTPTAVTNAAEQPSRQP